MTSRIATYKMLLEGIRFRGRHGVSKAERGLPQDFVANVEIELPLSALPRSDSLRQVYDYGRLSQLVVDEGTTTSCKLLETLAERLISRILAESPAVSVSVRIKKFGPPTPVSVDAASIELFGVRGDKGT
ncbi:MAG: dihydroneopterin aldolase [Polyangiaceae bacterium]|nr:dihydroneopterin aldolase [Polyangiaceae bacterium]